MKPITEPGIYPGIPEAEYHSHPALSASNMKKLLPPNAPAIFDYERKQGQQFKPAFSFGRAAHAELLGIGSDIEIVQKVTRDKQRVDADTYDTVSAKKHVEEILAEGKTPLLAKEAVHVKGMVAAVRADKIASKLLAPSDGTAEASAFWTDAETGVPLRGRFDFLRVPDANGRLLLPDYKTSESADPREFARSSAKFNYPLSAANYIDGLVALGYAQDIEFLFVVQMKTPPYLVSVIGLKHKDLTSGRDLKHKAIYTFKHCTETGDWPGYSSEVHYPDLPVWWSYYVEEITA